MFDIAVEQEISAGHQLRGYRGKCENCHGHNWKIRLEVSVPDLDELGLGIDFTVLKKVLGDILEVYDHTMLNELPEFSRDNPTSENLARVIYRQARQQLQAMQVQVQVTLKTVLVWESPRAFVRYYE
jgi:6-pyruvoyltetrahydropterin/6-carboxytetrahydropterin synthase